MGQNSVGEAPKNRKQFCNICNKHIGGNSFCLKAHLYHHKKVEPRFTCVFCSKQYFRKDVYNRHLEIHTGRRKFFICDFCDRSFVDKRNLISHLKIHDDSNTKFRRYTCKACGMEYCENRLLQYHIRKEHFNLQPKEEILPKKQPNETWVEKVLETDVCVQITKLNNNVISIKKCDTIKEESETGKYDVVTFIDSEFGKDVSTQYSKAVCAYCNKEMLKKSLQNHMRERHLNIRRFKCEVCKRSFNRHYQMTDHKCGKKKRRSYKD